MRRILTFTATILIAASALAASEIYRWKDTNGTWHYSDQPQPGAELVRRGGRPVTPETPATPAPSTPVQAPATSADPLPVSDAVAAQVREAAAAAKSEQCKKADETYNKAIQNYRIIKADGTSMTSAEIDAYRLQARSARDEICGPGPYLNGRFAGSRRRMNPVRPPKARLLLPDFCTPRALLLLLTIVTLTALLLTLADAGLSPQFWNSLTSKLMFLVWIGLLGAALLCALRPQIAARGAVPGALLVLAVVTALVLALSEIAFRVVSSPLLNPYLILGQAPRSHWLFMARNLAISLIVSTVALRYSYISQQWRLRVEGEARARIDALQARIRPHFLYNSMNTIAALTRSDPARAEEAVLDLADLFRASLDEKRGLIPLADELEAARTYQRIEQLRLGSRLRVRWQVDDLPLHALVPALTLQPLLENAIGHGIENLPEGGEVTIEGTAAAGTLLIAVRNPLPLDGASADAEQRGLGLALDNIRERLALLFGTRASVAAGREGDEFTVQLRIPVTETEPESQP